MFCVCLCVSESLFQLMSLISCALARCPSDVGWMPFYFLLSLSLSSALCHSFFLSLHLVPTLTTAVFPEFPDNVHQSGPLDQSLAVKQKQMSQSCSRRPDLISSFMHMHQKMTFCLTDSFSKSTATLWAVKCKVLFLYTKFDATNLLLASLQIIKKSL